MRRTLLLLAGALSGCAPPANDTGGAPAPLPVSHARPERAFTGLALPAPGTYVLDQILQTPSAAVLDSDGSRQPLRRFLTGKVTLFAFIYTACSDARGCPLALATMHALKGQIARDPRLREQVRLVSMSFDPAYDTPEAMRSYGGIDGRPAARPRWHFLTAPSPQELVPVLRGFGQEVRTAELNATGAVRAPLEHLLKIYLIDSKGAVREIYSPAFLQADALLADILSLVAQG